MNNTDYSIVVPFRDEKKNLEILLPALAKVIKDQEASVEVILVNDCSSDDSLLVCKHNKLKFDKCLILELPHPSGQTGAFRAAFSLAQGEYLIRMDADLQDNPEDLPLFFEKFRQGSDLVMGLRECRKHRRLFRLASVLYDGLILLLFDTPLHTNSGSYVGFRSHLIKNIPWHPNDHRYLPLIALRRGAKNVGEVIVRHSPRVYGQSKYKPLRKILFGIPEVILFILRLNRGKYDIR
tara:strand:+ start:2234 stop:2944 length:711 start_codon:yes stop_codon:yes gene_type:complete